MNALDRPQGFPCSLIDSLNLTTLNLNCKSHERSYDGLNHFMWPSETLPGLWALEPSSVFHIVSASIILVIPTLRSMS